MAFAWLIWSMIFLLLWIMLYLVIGKWRKQMLAVSFWTMPFGLTEPLFVPDYWNPPTLFNLAQTTGFDIESLLFTFAIGGIASVLYQLISRASSESLPQHERLAKRHRLHRLLLLSPFIIFVFLSATTKLNHIYCGMIAMFCGAVATLVCRPDLKLKIWIGGTLFALIYIVFFELLNVFYSGYVGEVWNFKNISGMLFIGIPIEEILFGFAFGMYWSSVYEHLLWRQIASSDVPKKVV